MMRGCGPVVSSTVMLVLTQWVVGDSHHKLGDVAALRTDGCGWPNSDGVLGGEGGDKQGGAGGQVDEHDDLPPLLSLTGPA